MGNLIKGVLLTFMAAGMSAAYGLQEVNPRMAAGETNLPMKLVPTAEEAKSFTTKDANEDKVTWVYEPIRKSFHYAGNKDLAANDWLFLPVVKIGDAEMYYSFSMDSWVTPYKYSIAMARDFAKFEVYVGNTNTPEGMTTQIVPTTTVRTDSTETVSSFARFTVGAPGDYYIGIKVVSDKNKKYFNVNNFEVKQDKVSTHGPGQVVDLKAEGGEKGALTATVSFKLPTKDLSGKDLSGEVSATVKSVIEEKTVSGAPGSEQSVTLRTKQSTSTETNVITVTPKTGSYTGMPTETEVWCGVEIPGKPANVRIIANETNMGGKLVWDKVTAGEKGGYVDPKGMTYYLYQKATLGFRKGVSMGKDINEYNFLVTAGSEQGLMSLGVGADNVAGSGKNGTSQQEALGMPWPMPAKEIYTSTSGGSYKQVTTSYSGTAVTYGYKDPAKVKAEYGSADVPFAYTGTCKGTSTGTINLPKFSTEGVSKAAFLPMIYAGGCANLTVGVKGYGTEEKEIYDLSKDESLKGKSGYTELTIGLPEEMQNRKWVQIVLHPEFTSEKQDFILGGYKLRNMVDTDISATGIKAPGKARNGDKFRISVDVSNYGLKEIGSYRVDLYADGELAGSESGEKLAPDSTATVAFDLTMGAVRSKEITYVAKAVCDGDSEEGNNMTGEAIVTPKASALPAATGLRASSDLDAKAVKLTWTAPNVVSGSPTSVTEDFEEGTAFAAEHEGWVLTDADKSPVAGFNGIPIPGITVGQTTGSFWIWDQSKLGNQTFAAHSGTKYLFSMTRYDRGESDDWAISPELSGEEQKVSFYAKSYIPTSLERIELLYSTGSTETKDFVKIENAGGTVPNEWKEYEIALPAGAKRFAIRKTTLEGGMLMVDDVKMTPAPEIPEGLELEGYDVYRDGRKLNSERIGVAAYDDKAVANGETYEYQVVAVYNKGISGATEGLKITYGNVGVGETMADGRIESGKGFLRVTGFEGGLIRVITADGQVAGERRSQGDVEFRLPAGVYVVMADGKAVKVAVR